ncbi:MAG: phytanoyl-CoA dioxygenase family protein [Alphaproteobacteria bacterium]|nr:phytanoyl-CoA dioxygenase family protein [Alphaproteobacteria bacterium]
MDRGAIEHFHEHGWALLPRALCPEEAAAMRGAVWHALADVGIRRDQPSTWTVERPAHLQRLKEHPAFRSVSSPRLLAAIDAILGGRTYQRPKNWGALFIAFPAENAWNIPASGWHIDANYMSALNPPGGVKTLALFDDVAPRCGGTQIVGGSHRLVHDWFRQNPPGRGARSAEMRKQLARHPYIRALHAGGDANERTTRFMDRAEICDGVPLQVVECAGSAGDVFLLHPLTFHVATTNTGKAPRFMLSGGVTTNMWGWRRP